MLNTIEDIIRSEKEFSMICSFIVIFALKQASLMKNCLENKEHVIKVINNILSKHLNGITLKKRSIIPESIYYLLLYSKKINEKATQGIDIEINDSK